MATIKTVAALAGVSLSTVSIIANGRGDERKISPATQERVRAAMRELGYVPNMAARRLRDGARRKLITLFWADDFREAMLARFLKGLHAAIESVDAEVDVSVTSYRSGCLSDVQALATSSPAFDGAIVANANESDLAFLRDYKSLAPIVLYNRELDGYASASVSDEEIGRVAADLVQEALENCHAPMSGELRDCDVRAGVVACLSAPRVFSGMAVREETFLERVGSFGARGVIVALPENTARGGYEAARALDLGNIRCVFAPSDTVAIGFLRGCAERGVRIPQDLGVVAVGNGLPEYARYSSPPLTCVDVPMEQMAADCLDLLLAQVGPKKPDLERRQIPVTVSRRESL